ncbi:DUF5906 domain-containing protein [Natrinema salinisoli]|uniref:DUF5906 domain-containing protein n=1 Tax=Natrinema salinisoli TaxID=2878535 RepID=UPI001CF0B37D|nr:DUF5906 domain-containing protein [Natrinema salinisoli]
MPRDERHDRGDDEEQLPDMNADDALDGVTTADSIDSNDDVDLGVDMDAGDVNELDPVVNSDGTVVAHPVGLEALADPESGKYACIECDARSGSEHAAKVHFGKSHPNHDPDDDVDTGASSASVDVDIVEVANEYIDERIREAGLASDPSDHDYGDVPDVDGVTLRAAKHTHSRFTDVVVAVENGVDTGDVLDVIEAMPHGSQDAKIGSVYIIIADRPQNLHGAYDDLQGSLSDYGHVTDVMGVEADGSVVTAEPPVTPDETDDAEDWSDLDIGTTDDDDDGGAVDDDEITWGDVRDAYANARVQASPVTRNDARDRVVAVLESECEWMSIVERSEPGKYDLWHLTGDGWQEDGYTHVETQMRTELGAIASDTEVGHIVAQLATVNYVEQEETNARHLDETFIPVGNGVINVDDIEYDPATMTIDWDTVTVQDMDSEHRFLYRVETDWDPENADLDGLDEWLETITRTDEERRLIWEFAGHSAHPRYPADGFTVFNGRGGSGKSQTLEVIKAMLGGSNVAVETMQSIQTERFAGRRVVDKRANINTELEGTKMPSIGTLKTFSAGEEVSVEGKGTAAFDALNDATMMFASDSPPAFPQSNRAVGRRVYPVEFPCIYKSDPDPDNPLELQSRPKGKVQDELQADARLKAALMRAVEGLVRILREGDFTSELTENERLEKYESFADPIRDSVRECVQPCSDGVIESGDLERTLGAYMDMAGHDGKKMQQIWNVMQEMTDIPVTKDRTRTFAEDKEKHTVYEGIGFTDAALEHCVPDSAYWGEYTDQDDVEDDEFEGVELGEITDPGRYDAVKVTVASVEDEPAPWLHDQGVLMDDSHSLRYEVQSGISLDEGEVYVLRDVIVAKDEADLKMQLIDGMTDVFRIEERDDEQDAAVEDPETGDSPGYADDSEDSGTVEEPAYRDGDGDEADDRVTVKDIVSNVEDAHDDGAPVDKVIELAMHDAGLDRGEVEHKLEKLRHTGDVYEPSKNLLRVV